MGDLIAKGKKVLTNAVNDAGKGWDKGTASVQPQAQRPRRPYFIFPMDMLVEKLRPYIKFTCEPYKGADSMSSVYLPCPGGVSFSDGGSYTTIDMGMIGDIASAFASGGSAVERTSAVAGMFKKQAEGLGAMGASILVAKTLGANDIATGIEFANKSVRNPRTNTAFSGNTLRNFQFDFKMIGKNTNEVNEINEIQSFFREQVYASKLNGISSVMQQYPNQWTIRFMDPRNGKELTYMPKIYTCYLTAVNVVVNSTSNTFRTDMSPYEIDVSIQFQETKILDRDEINALEGGSRINRDDEAYDQLSNDVSSIATSLLNRLTGAAADAVTAAEDINGEPEER